MAAIMPEWTILLIGGSSATGKTTLGRALARHYDASLLHLDDLRLAIEQITTPAQHPTLHRINSDPTAWQSGETYRDALIATAETLAPALAIVIGNHLAQRTEFDPVIIEGDGILPRIAAPEYAPRLPQIAPVSARELAAQVRALVMYEGDADVIAAAMHAWGRGYVRRTPEAQAVQARGSWLYGEWLCAEAVRLALPVLKSRPYEAAMPRAIQVLQRSLLCG